MVPLAVFVTFTRHYRQYCCRDCHLLSLAWLSCWLLLSFMATPVSTFRLVHDHKSGANHHGFRNRFDFKEYSILSRQSKSQRCIHDHDDNANCDSSVTRRNTQGKQLGRRGLLQFGSTTLISAWTAIQVPSCCYAGEVGRRITEAVTTSELGVSVRRSVVRGAQIMDAWDLRAEKFSDTFQLGSERSKQQKRPLPKRIPPLQSLDTTMARNIVQCIDSVFCSTTNIPPSTLQQRVRLVTSKVQPSFERSGVTLPSTLNDIPLAEINDDIQNGPQFNFVLYVHYKSYTELWLETFGTKKDFAAFQKQFEAQVGKQLLSLFIPSSSSSSPPPPPSSLSSMSNSIQRQDDGDRSNDPEQALNEALRRIDALSERLVSHGFAAQMDRTSFEEEEESSFTRRMDVSDWSRGLVSDLSWSIALDNDITLSSQILLQEQGIRFYPNYIRCMIQSILQESLAIPFQQRIVTEDYYLDTDYNSDPDKFEVKEVLININIENTL